MDDVEFKQKIQAIQTRIIRELFSDEGRARADRFELMQRFMPMFIIFRRSDISFEEISDKFNQAGVDFPAEEIEQYFHVITEDVQSLSIFCAKASGMEEVVRYVIEQGELHDPNNPSSS